MCSKTEKLLGAQYHRTYRSQRAIETPLHIKFGSNNVGLCSMHEWYWYIFYLYTHTHTSTYIIGSILIYMSKINGLLELTSEAFLLFCLCPGTRMLAQDLRLYASSAVNVEVRPHPAYNAFASFTFQYYLSVMYGSFFPPVILLLSRSVVAAILRPISRPSDILIWRMLGCI